MKLLRIFSVLVTSVAFAQEPTPVPKPPANASKDVWKSYATYVEAVVAYREAQLEAARNVSAKIDAIVSGIAALDAKISAAPLPPPPVPPPVPPPPGTPPPPPPVIDGPQAVTPGATLTLIATADGVPPPTFQWKKDGVILPGATSSIYEIQSFQLVHAGSYVVVATNAAGSTPSAPYEVTVAAAGAPSPPVFTRHPATVVTQAGADVTFDVAVTGSPMPTIQWLHNGTPIAGATNTTYVRPAVPASDSNSVFRAKATNTSGTAMSNEANLWIQ